jgi:hypothetical protein
MITTALAQLAGEPFVHRVASHIVAADEIIHTNNILGAITQYVVPLLLAVLGVIFISRAGKGEMSKVLTSSAIAIVGLAFIAGAGVLFAFGQKLVDLIFK